MQKPLNEQRLENIALFYLGQYEASSEKLRQVLKRRLDRQKMQGIISVAESKDWVDNVVQHMQELGYVNDERYAINAVRRWSEQGKSSFVIRQKLHAERIDSELIEHAFQESGDDDFARACIFVRKKKLGSDYEKDLEKMARVGFDYETAKQALSKEATNAESACSP